MVELRRGKILWETFTFNYYVTRGPNASVMDALTNTAIVALCPRSPSPRSSRCCWRSIPSGMAPWARLLMLIIYLPFLLPPIVTGLALLVPPANQGMNRGIATIVIGHTIFVLAIAYRLVLTGCRLLPQSMIEASFDLGASRSQTLRLVLPAASALPFSPAPCWRSHCLRRDC